MGVRHGIAHPVLLREAMVQYAATADRAHLRHRCQSRRVELSEAELSGARVIRHLIMVAMEGTVSGLGSVLLLRSPLLQLRLGLGVGRWRACRATVPTAGELLLSLTIPVHTQAILRADSLGFNGGDTLRFW
jgi:hypothetical protein